MDRSTATRRTLKRCTEAKGFDQVQAARPQLLPRYARVLESLGRVEGLALREQIEDRLLEHLGVAFEA